MCHFQTKTYRSINVNNYFYKRNLLDKNAFIQLKTHLDPRHLLANYSRRPARVFFGIDRLTSSKYNIMHNLILFRKIDFIRSKKKIQNVLVCVVGMMISRIFRVKAGVSRKIADIFFFFLHKLQCNQYILGSGNSRPRCC